MSELIKECNEKLDALKSKYVSKLNDNGVRIHSVYFRLGNFTFVCAGRKDHSQLQIAKTHARCASG